jgi:AraC-like DNA-binding protein
MHKVKRYVCQDKLRLFYIHFKPEDPILEKILKEERVVRSWSVSDVDPQQNFLAIEKIYNSVDEQRFYYIHESPFDAKIMAAQIKLQKMIVDIVDHIMNSPSDDLCHMSPRTSKIKSSILYMDKNYCEMPKINELADMSRLSPEYFISVFKKAFKKTPHQYMLEKRISKAKQLLRYECAKVKDVAKECGYKDEFHFSKTFKKSTGITPKVYAMEGQAFEL